MYVPLWMFQYTLAWTLLGLFVAACFCRGDNFESASIPALVTMLIMTGPGVWFVAVLFSLITIATRLFGMKGSSMDLWSSFQNDRADYAMEEQRAQSCRETRERMQKDGTWESYMKSMGRLVDKAFPD